MSDNRKILLLPVDGSPASARALQLVAAYRGERSRLAPVVLNVQRPPLTMWPHPAIDPEAIEAALRAEGEREVGAARTVLAAAGFDAETVVRIGMPSQAILEEANARRATAIVMGTRGRGGLQAFALGSVASRVAHGSKIPTILVRQNTRLPEEFGRRERVLVAVDGSQQAVNAAARLASWSDWLGTIAADVAHVHEQLTVLDAILPPHDDVLEQWSGRESEEATRGARNVFAATDIRHDVHGATGEPAARIARLAEELASDLIVMGTRGRGVAHHAFIGSVALKVAKLSPVPVALVP